MKMKARKASLASTGIMVLLLAMAIGGAVSQLVPSITGLSVYENGSEQEEMPDTGILTMPVMQQIKVNTTSWKNYTTDNLVCWANATDSAHSRINYTVYWYLNGSRILKLNWNKSYDYTSSDEFLGDSQMGYGVATDSSKNIIVTGRWGWAMGLFKYNSAGTKVWDTYYTIGTPTQPGTVYGIKVKTDTSGNIYVFGTQAIPGSYWKIYAAKYNSAGSQQWVRVYPYESWGGDVAVDNSGDVIMVGRRKPCQVIVKYNSNGAQLWEIPYSQEFGSLSAVTTDVYDDIIVAGQDDSSAKYLAGYLSDGSQAWERSYPEFGYNGFNDVKMVSLTTAAAVGERYLIRFNIADGSVIWNRSISGGFGGKLAIDSLGNIVVNSRDYILKYDLDGNWLGRYEIGFSDSGVAVDSSNDIIITGATYGTNNDILLKKFSGTTYENFTARGINRNNFTNISTIPASNTSEGDVWWCEARPDDGTYFPAFFNRSNNITINSVIKPAFTNIRVAGKYEQYLNFTANATISDVRGIDYIKFYTNMTGTWLSDNISVGGATSYTASTTKNITADYGSTVCWYYWANNTWEETNTTSTYCFTVTETPPWFTNALNYSFDEFRKNTNFYANITINDDDALDYYIFSTNVNGNWQNDTPFYIGGATEYNATKAKTIANLDEGDEFCWYYWANDTNSVSAQSTTYCLRVKDETPPTINTHNATPNITGIGGIVTITANVTDKTEVQTVKLGVTPPGGTEENLTMENISGNVYSFNYSQPINGTINGTGTFKIGQYTYKIYAQDTTGNINTATGTFNITGSAEAHLNVSKEVYYNYKNFSGSTKYGDNVRLESVPEFQNLTFRINVNFDTADDWEDQADIVWVIDAQDGTQDFYDELADNIDYFTQRLQERNIDYRMGVTAFLYKNEPLSPYYGISNSWPISTSGERMDPFSKGWELTALNTYEGAYSAKAGNITDGQVTSVYLTEDVPSGGGTIKFARKVSSEEEYDFLNFYVNGELKGSWSGEIGWDEEEYQLQEGVNKLKWAYIKDSSVSDGEDTAWIDKVQITSGNTETFSDGFNDGTLQPFTTSRKGEWTTNNTEIGIMAHACRVPKGSRGPGLLAINETLNHYTFRTNAKKIFIIITTWADLEYYTPWLGEAFVTSLADTMKQNDTSVFTPGWISYYNITMKTGGSFYEYYANYDTPDREVIMSNLADDVAESMRAKTGVMGAVMDINRWTNQSSRTVRQIMEEEAAVPGSRIPSDLYTNPSYTISSYEIEIINATGTDGQDHSDGVEIKFADSEEGSEISWTNTAAIENSQVFIKNPKNIEQHSYFANTGNYDIAGFFTLKAQRWNGTAFADNQTKLYMQYTSMASGGIIQISDYWNQNPFSAYGMADGVYRVYAELTDKNGTVIIDSEGNAMNATGEFNISWAYLCGQNVTSNLVLDNDVRAPAEYELNKKCLTMFENTTLDCNGYRIIGSQTPADNLSVSYSNAKTGIHSYNIKNATITNCNVSNFDFGIFILYSQENNLTNNNMFSNSYNFGVDSYTLNSTYFNHYIDTTNLVDGKPIVYIKNAVGTTYDSSTNAGAFYCINCTNITVNDLNIKHNILGISLVETSNATLKNLNVTNNWLGIMAVGGRDSDSGAYNITGIGITGSNISYNSNVGIYFEAYTAKDIEISGNYMERNNWNSIELEVGSASNVIISNNLIKRSYSDPLYSDNAKFDNFTISNNTITYNGYAIDLYQVELTNSRIEGNTIRYNGAGIYQYDKDFVNNTIVNNDISLNDYPAIQLDDSRNIQNNIIANNTINYNLDYAIEAATDYNFTDNIIDGNEMRMDWSGAIYLEVWYSIGNFSNNKISNNILSEGWGYGIETYIYSDVSNIQIINNSINYNLWEAIYWESDGDVSKNIAIENNTIIESDYAGIYFYNGYDLENLSIRNNKINNNRRQAVGVYIENDGYAANIAIENNEIVDSYYESIYFYNWDDISNLSITGNNMPQTSEGDYQYGVWLYLEGDVIDNVNISNNYIEGTADAIDVYDYYGQTTNLQINNNIILNSASGIYCEGIDLDRASFKNNIIYNVTWQGIYLIFDNINSSEFSNNSINISTFEGIGLESYETIENTTISGNTISRSQTGILLGYYDMLNNTVRGNRLIDNSYTGIYFESDDQRFYNNRVDSNTIEGSMYAGLAIWDYSTTPPFGISITNNNFTNNLMSILLTDESKNISMSGNRIYDSPVGIGIFGNNTQAYNNYLRNNINVIANGINTTLNTSLNCAAGQNLVGQNCIGGNYWSDYNGSDANGDGIGDTAYNLTAGGEMPADYLPLVYSEIGIWDETDAIGGGAVKYPGDSVKFTANFTANEIHPETATCRIQIGNQTSALMSAENTSITEEYWKLESISSNSKYVSLAIGSDDSLYAVYDTPNSIAYRKMEPSGTWSSEEVVEQFSPSEINVSTEPTIEVDTSGNVHIAYALQNLTSARYSLKYARYNGTGWKKQVVENLTTTGGIWSPSIDTYNNNPAIAACRKGEAVYFYNYSSATDSWGMQKAHQESALYASCPNTTNTVTLKFDIFGKPYIFYGAQVYGYVYPCYATTNITGWHPSICEANNGGIALAAEIFAGSQKYVLYDSKDSSHSLFDINSATLAYYYPGHFGETYHRNDWKRSVFQTSENYTDISMAITPTSKTHFVYGYWSNKGQSILYAHVKDSTISEAFGRPTNIIRWDSWEMDVVANSGLPNTSSMSIKVDSNESPHIIFVNGSGNAVYAAKSQRQRNVTQYSYTTSFDSVGEYNWSVNCTSTGYPSSTINDTVQITATPPAPPSGGGGPTAPTCENECTAGSARCSGNSVQSCQTGTDGCTDWVTTTTCGYGYVCNGATATCQNCITCTAGTTRCDGSNTERCTSTGDGCTEWQYYQTCGTGFTCFDGECRECGECTNPGSLRCSGNTVQKCSLSGACLAWETYDTCEEGEVCKGNRCVTEQAAVEIPSEVAAPPAGGGCTEVLQKTSTTTLSTRQVPISEIQIPTGYEIVKQPFQIDCRGDSFYLTLNIPSNYNDITALRCAGGTCMMQTETTTTKTFSCGTEIATEITEEERYLAPQQMAPIISQEKAISETDRTINSGNNKIEFLPPLPLELLVTLKGPETPIPQPPNPELVIVGTPLVAKITTDAQRLGATITLPYTTEEIEENSIAIYALQDKTWTLIGGTTNKETKTINARIDNIIPLLKNNEATFATIAIKCEYCQASQLEKAYSYPGSRDAIILIHGMGSNPSTFTEMIQEFEYNQQPWQIWTFGYSPSREIDAAAEELANLLESHSLEYDNIYLVAHSLGGLITQTALQKSYQQTNRYTYAGKIRKAIMIAVPNEGSPGAELYQNLYKYLVNFKGKGGIFDVNSNVIAEIVKGRITPRIPNVDYYVIAGTKPYEFNLGLFKAGAETLGIEETNDGLVTTKSAQHIGDNYVNNMCKDYWEIHATHTEIIDAQPSVKVIQKILSDSIAEKYADIELLGRNQYFKLRVDECSPTDTYILIGKKVRQETILDELCGCGNGFCGQGEDALNCPADCARIMTKETVFVSGPILIYAMTILAYVFSLTYTVKKHFLHGTRKRWAYITLTLTTAATIIYRINFQTDLYLAYGAITFAVAYLVSVDRIIERIAAQTPKPLPTTAPMPEAPAKPAEYIPEKQKPSPTPEKAAEKEMLIRQEHEIKRRIADEKQRIALMERMGPARARTYETAKSMWSGKNAEKEIEDLKSRISYLNERLKKDIDELKRGRKK